MTEKKSYVAYVGTYTNGTSRGIHIYDVDVEEGLLFLRRVVPVKNSSYLTVSRNEEYLYSVADDGVEVFKILPDGDLEAINQIEMDGMRGHQLTHDHDSRYLFVAGYHDGKITMIRTNKDGSLGKQLDGVFHHSVGGIGDLSWQPHVCCVRMTRDNKFLCGVDNALNQISLYRINPHYEKLEQIDILRMGRNVGPRSIHFSLDGRFAYVLCEITCSVRLYQYHLDENGYPVFDYIEEYGTLCDDHDVYDAAASMNLSGDGKYLICSNAGDNSIAIFSVDQETGRLTRILALPIAGLYPKDTCLFPDSRHVAVVNNGSNTITTFAVDYEKGTIVMKGRPQELDKPNCMRFKEIKEAPAQFRHISEKEAEAEAEEIMRNKAR